MQLIVTVGGNAPAAFAAIVGNYPDARSALVVTVAEALQQTLKAVAPVGRHYDSGGNDQGGGALRDSLDFEIGPDGATLMGAAHGLYVIGGARPHPITVRNARALRFWWQRAGQVFIGPSVNHPGNNPDDFRLVALARAYGDGTLEAAAAQFWQSLLGSAAAEEG